MSITPLTDSGHKYIYGLEMKWVGDDEVDISAGGARDSSNANDIILDDVVQLDMNKNGAGGIDNGAYDSNSQYAVYVIGDATKSKPNTVIASKNALSPVMPFDYNLYRRIGFIKSASASEIIEGFYQVSSGLSRTFWYETPSNVLTGGNATSYASGVVDLSVGVPAVQFDSYCHVYLRLNYLVATAGNKVEIRPADSSSIVNPVEQSNVVAAKLLSTVVKAVAYIDNTGIAKIEYKTSSGGDSVSLDVLGYEERLG